MHAGLLLANRSVTARPTHMGGRRPTHTPDSCTASPHDDASLASCATTGLVITSSRASPVQPQLRLCCRRGAGLRGRRPPGIHIYDGHLGPLRPRSAFTLPSRQLGTLTHKAITTHVGVHPEGAVVPSQQLPSVTKGPRCVPAPLHINCTARTLKSCASNHDSSSQMLHQHSLVGMTQRCCCPKTSTLSVARLQCAHTASDTSNANSLAGCSSPKALFSPPQLRPQSPCKSGLKKPRRVLTPSGKFPQHQCWQFKKLDTSPRAQHSRQRHATWLRRLQRALWKGTRPQVFQVSTPALLATATRRLNV